MLYEVITSMGRIGKAQIDKDGNAAMAAPFVYDASNVQKFAKIF